MTCPSFYHTVLLPCTYQHGSLFTSVGIWDIATNVSFGKPMGFLHQMEDIGGTIKDAYRTLDYFATVCP